MDAKVSIAVVTYNQADLLGECLASIAAQTYPHIEVVVADDASTDNTRHVVDAFQDHFGPRLTAIFGAENEGITANCNRAHAACSGEYVAWIGGDDIMLPTKIEKQVSFMTKNPDCAISYHNLDVFLSDTGETLRLMNDSHKYEGGAEVVVRRGTFNGASSTMVRRSAVPSWGFDSRIPIASDWLYWIETLACGGRICYIDEVLGRYRRHERNATGGSSAQQMRNLEDHIVTAAIVMAKYPQYGSEARARLAELLRLARTLTGTRYSEYLRLSLGVKFSPKTLAALAVHVASLRRCRP